MTLVASFVRSLATVAFVDGRRGSAYHRDGGLIYRCSARRDPATLDLGRTARPSTEQRREHVMGASMMAGPHGTATACAPRPSVMWSIALVGCAASVVSVSLAATFHPNSGAIAGEAGKPLVVAPFFWGVTPPDLGWGLVAWGGPPA